MYTETCLRSTHFHDAKSSLAAAENLPLAEGQAAALMAIAVAVLAVAAALQSCACTNCA